VIVVSWKAFTNLWSFGRRETSIARPDVEKITRIRQKIEIVFGRASTWDNATISERYDITVDGDLIMILR
jgi:hypothetical protein